MFKKTLISLAVMSVVYENFEHLDTRFLLDKNNFIDFSEENNYELISSDLDIIKPNFIDKNRFNNLGYSSFKNRYNQR
jgi:hypothetical protein